MGLDERLATVEAKVENAQERMGYFTEQNSAEHANIMSQLREMQGRVPPWVAWTIGGMAIIIGALIGVII